MGVFVEVLIAVGGIMLVIYAHIGAFSLLDNVVSAPAAVGLLLLGDALVVVAFMVLTRKQSRRQPPRLRPISYFEAYAQKMRNSPERGAVATVTALVAARRALDPILTECIQPGADARVSNETIGWVHVSTRNASYLYLARSASDYFDDPSYRSEEVKTIALRWSVGVDSPSTGRTAGTTVTMTIDRNGRPQLGVTKNDASYPGTPDGFAAMLDELRR